METRIHQFIHKNKGKRALSKGKEVVTPPSGPFKAVLVAQVLPTNPALVGIGWAMARTENGKFVDKFDREVGLRLATDRAALQEPTIIPFTLTAEVNRFVARAKKYFKDKDVLVPEISTEIPKVAHPKTAIDKRFGNKSMSIRVNRLKKGDIVTVLQFDTDKNSSNSYKGEAFTINAVDLPFIVGSSVKHPTIYTNVIIDTRVATLKITSPEYVEALRKN